jgi:TPM domain
VGYRFDGLLSAFEKETSSQIAVAVYPHLPAGSVEKFTLRTAERSRLGRKGLDNGAILFVFMAERVARLEVGYGLEGALPDITAIHILDQDLAPRFARGEYTGGLDASLAAILAAVRAWFSFLGGLLVFVVWSGLANGARLACAVVRGGWNLVRHRPFGTEIRQVNFSSIWDSLKIVAFFAVFFVAIEVLVAYGGAFGGAGGLIRW